MTKTAKNWLIFFSFISVAWLFVPICDTHCSDCLDITPVSFGVIRWSWVCKSKWELNEAMKSPVSSQDHFKEISFFQYDSLYFLFFKFPFFSFERISKAMGCFLNSWNFGWFIEELFIRWATPGEVNTTLCDAETEFKKYDFSVFTLFSQTRY